MSASGPSDPERARRLIPGGCHTYAKGDDQFPANAPRQIVRGRGAEVWDPVGRRFLEYGSGLRAVTLGHAFPEVVEAVQRQLASGTNFCRPAPIELECAERLLSLIRGADMAKFCKDGSTAVDAAIRIARAVTGRDMVAACADHPFFSTGDWFIGSTAMPAGIPAAVRAMTLKFPYNDAQSLEALFEEHRGRIACVILEPARTEEPRDGFLQRVRDLCSRHGALLVLDEMITGFRWNLHGGQFEYGVVPDLSTFGKGLANGFSVSALVGRREFMELGGFDHERERVFVLSTTHGAETHALAAAIATMDVYTTRPVIETLRARGARLRKGFDSVVQAHGLSKQLQLMSRDCNLLFVTRDSREHPSQEFRTLFMQELVRGGVLAPSFVVGFSHSESDIDATLEAVQRALPVYAAALSDGVGRFLEGPPVKPAFRPRA